MNLLAEKKVNVHASDEYYNLVPRPSAVERRALKQSIMDEGQLVPIIINEDGLIIDGHTRFEICQELGLDARCVVKKFDNKDDEKEYAIITNLKRRHLNPFQISFLIDDLREKWKQELKQQTNEHVSRVKRGLEKPTPKKDRLKNLNHMRAAEICGVESATMQKIDYIKLHGTEFEIKSVKTGRKSIEQVYRKIVNRRHKTEAKNIRNTRVYPDCPKCGGMTRHKGRCHVHSSYCCLRCDGGV